MAENKEDTKGVKPEDKKATQAEKLKDTNLVEDVVASAEEEDSYLKDLMAISGHGGLFRFVTQGHNGIIVESIETGKRMQAFATMKVSALEDIAIYTEDDEVKFEEIVASIHTYEKGKEAISPKSSPDELKEYFAAILPEYDRDRVYVSDIKKVLNWYNLLLKYDLIEIGKKKASTKANPEKEAKPELEKEAKSEAETEAKSEPDKEAKSEPEN